MNDFYIIYTQRLAAYLMLKGFKLEGLRENKHDPLKNVFLFLDSEELEEAVKQYKHERR